MCPHVLNLSFLGCKLPSNRACTGPTPNSCSTLQPGVAEIGVVAQWGPSSEQFRELSL